jgi:hypothetical protein
MGLRIQLWFLSHCVSMNILESTYQVLFKKSISIMTGIVFNWQINLERTDIMPMLRIPIDGNGLLYLGLHCFILVVWDFEGKSLINFS